MNPNDSHRRDDDGRPTTGDALDRLLRDWHRENRTSAEAARDRVLAAAAEDEDEGARKPRVAGRIGFGGMLRGLAVAALLALAFTLAFLFTRASEKRALAFEGTVQVAEGGVLAALDADGDELGPCPLQHTEVKVEISGPFARTIVEQTYANPYPRTIEAVYTFPLSNRAAVDGMTMIVRGDSGERVIEGEVKERALARAIYEEARESGYVASLLEQERPNIFTQSVANIEPGATVKVRIATIEMARRKDGVAEFVFPMVVGPRYIPGAPTSMPALPAGWLVRRGLVLRGPAGVEMGDAAALGAARMLALLEGATPVRPDGAQPVDEMLTLGDGERFTARYANGSAERGTYYAATGLGEINGRFFFAPLDRGQGTGFAGDTDEVPDASRITPMPVKPSERAGHDITVSVAIETGGPAVTEVACDLHAIRIESPAPSRRIVTLDGKATIPNRDFILRWKVADDAIEPAFFAHAGEIGTGVASADPSTGASGVARGSFALLLDPPARVAPAEIRPRELVFVLDVSGSMNGFPIEKSKALARKAIAAMRPNDTFNIITFAGATSVLWPEPKPATDENRRAADAFVDGAYGAGGTEMMAAINAALVQDGRSGMVPAKLLDLPADGRAVRVAVEDGALVRGDGAWTLDAGAGRTISVELPIAVPANPKRLALLVDGTWETRDGERTLVARAARFEDADARTRFVFFLTDGYIGNDQGVIAAVRENARASRVFSFGIGNSVNRFLLEEMARAGRGACEVVTLADEADPVIERLVRRIGSPVLTDIVVEIDPALGVAEILPSGDFLPDLHDEEPIVLLGRYARAADGRARSGDIVVRGRTGAGPWERRVRVELPALEPAHDVVPTLWARAKVDEILLPRMAEVESGTLDAATKAAVIGLGEDYSIATPFTSFVAVEKSRVTVGGKAMLVAVPVELPDGTNWNGFFGEGVAPLVASTGGAPAVKRLVDRLGSMMVAADAGLGRGAGDESGAALRFQADTAVDAPATMKPGRGTESLSRDAVGPKDAVLPSGGAAGAVGGRRILRVEPGANTLSESAEPVQIIETRRSRGGAAPSGGFVGGGAFGGGMGGGTGGGTGGGGFGAPAPGAPVATPPTTASAPASRPKGPAGAAEGRRESPRRADRQNESQSAQGGGMPAAPAPVAEPAALAAEDALDATAERRAEPGVDALADGASAAPVDPIGLDEASRDRLVRVFERRLVLVVLAAILGDRDALAALPAELGLPLEDGKLRLAIRLRRDDGGRIDPGTLDALRKAAVGVVGRDDARGLVVAEVDPVAIGQLLRLDGVLRVEPLDAKRAR